MNDWQGLRKVARWAKAQVDHATSYPVFTSVYSVETLVRRGDIGLVYDRFESPNLWLWRVKGIHVVAMVPISPEKLCKLATNSQELAKFAREALGIERQIGGNTNGSWDAVRDAVAARADMLRTQHRQAEDRAKQYARLFNR